MTKRGELLVDEVFERRSRWEFATYMPELMAEATGVLIMLALESAVSRMRAASEAVVRVSQYKVGDLTLMFAKEGNIVCVGTCGSYPSANMLLLVEGTPIEEDRVYPKGTKFCFIHGKWKDYPWKRDLPMQEAFYTAVRRTFAALLEQELRQFNI